MEQQGIGRGFDERLILVQMNGCFMKITYEAFKKYKEEGKQMAVLTDKGKIRYWVNKEG